MFDAATVIVSRASRKDVLLGDSRRYGRWMRRRDIWYDIWKNNADRGVEERLLVFVDVEMFKDGGTAFRNVRRALRAAISRRFL